MRKKVMTKNIDRIFLYKNDIVYFFVQIAVNEINGK